MGLSLLFMILLFYFHFSRHYRQRPEFVQLEALFLPHKSYKGIKQLAFIFIFLGDIFSAHAVDNPNMESEMAMLRQYGPGVPEAILKRLVLAFGELRDMADQGLIAYPYSTREVVNMVRHLEVRKGPA